MFNITGLGRQSTTIMRVQVHGLTIRNFEEVSSLKNRLEYRVFQKESSNFIVLYHFKVTQNIRISFKYLGVHKILLTIFTFLFL